MYKIALYQSIYVNDSYWKFKIEAVYSAFLTF